METYMIYGAKSMALGIYTAMKELYSEKKAVGFLVNSAKNNPSRLARLPVKVLDRCVDKEIPIFIAVPDNVQGEVAAYLEEKGFYHYICMDSVKVASLMEAYYAKTGRLPLLHEGRKEKVASVGVADETVCRRKYADRGENATSVEADGTGEMAEMQIYMAKFHKDRKLEKPYKNPDWVVPLQVGAALTEERVAHLCDNAGDHISEKNVNYCELTALYWMWKNKCYDVQFLAKTDYIGLFHYRRILDIREEDRKWLRHRKVDVILPFPLMSEPDITEHHARYVHEGDWAAMLRALKELQPEYATVYPAIFSGNIMYNFNIMVAKPAVLAEYCAWLFPILQRTEELSNPKGWERADRYIGYLGENLATLYFMCNRGRLNIVHTGCLMLV